MILEGEIFIDRAFTPLRPAALSKSARTILGHESPSSCRVKSTLSRSYSLCDSFTNSVFAAYPNAANTLSLRAVSGPSTTPLSLTPSASWQALARGSSFMAHSTIRISNQSALRIWHWNDSAFRIWVPSGCFASAGQQRTTVRLYECTRSNPLPISRTFVLSYFRTLLCFLFLPHSQFELIAD